MVLSESPQELLHLAGTGLQALEWEAGMANRRAMQQGAARKLTTLTGLTRLQLCGFYGVDSCLHAVQTFVHLRELSLYRCLHMETQFFVPDALQSLQISSLQRLPI